jgi:hypothetical protein
MPWVPPCYSGVVTKPQTISTLCADTPSTGDAIAWIVMRRPSSASRSSRRRLNSLSLSNGRSARFFLKSFLIWRTYRHAERTTEQRRGRLDAGRGRLSPVARHVDQHLHHRRGRARHHHRITHRARVERHSRPTAANRAGRATAPKRSSRHAMAGTRAAFTGYFMRTREARRNAPAVAALLMAASSRTSD